MRRSNPIPILAVLAALWAAACSPAPRADTPAPTPDADLARGIPGATLDFMTLNIWHDQQDWPARLEVMLEGLRAADPDVICLQEVLQKPGLPNQAETLAEALGYRVHFASWDSAGSTKRYGNAILTRSEILDRGHRLLEPQNDYRVVAHVRIAPKGAPEGVPVDVYCTHLHHTQEQPGVEMRSAQARDALDYIDETRSDGPVIFAGDFNAEVASPELAPVLDRFRDAYGTVHGAAAEDVTTLNTAKGHRFTRIDHVFFRDGQRIDVIPVAAEVVLDEPSPEGIWPTDHFGVQVRFRLREAGSPTGPRDKSERSML